MITDPSRATSEKFRHQFNGFLVSLSIDPLDEMSDEKEVFSLIEEDKIWFITKTNLTIL